MIAHGKSMGGVMRFFWLAVLLVAWAGSVAADTRGINVQVKDTGGTTVALYAESHALVVGVSEYTNGWPRLRGVGEDIPAVKAALERQGFAVTVVMDPDRRQIDDAFRDFINRHGKLRDPLLDKGDFVFALSRAVASAPAVKSAPPSQGESAAIEIAFWDSIKDSGNRAMFEAYIKKYPSGNFTELARLKLNSLKKPRKPVPRTRPAPAKPSHPIEGAWSDGKKVIVLFADGWMRLFKNGRQRDKESGRYRLSGDILHVEREGYGPFELRFTVRSERLTLKQAGMNNETGFRRIANLRDAILEKYLQGRWELEDMVLRFHGSHLTVTEGSGDKDSGDFMVYGSYLFVISDDERPEVMWFSVGDNGLVLSQRGEQMVFRPAP